MLLIRDPTLAIPPKKNEYSKFLILFEFLFYDMQSNSESSVVLANIKKRLQDTAITFYLAFKKGNSSPFNWTKDEFETMCKLKNENYLDIQKGNKGNTIDILGKDSYLKWVETLLKDSSKFRNILVASDKYLNCMINSGKKESLICRKNSKKMKKPIINWGLLSTLYGSGKVRKPIQKIRLPLFRNYFFSDWYPYIQTRKNVSSLFCLI